MGKNSSEVIVKNLILFLIGSIILSACVTTPDMSSMEATVNAAVDSAVKTAVAPYESRYENFVTTDDLEASQQEQNKTIQQYITEHIDRVNTSRESEPTPVAEAGASVTPETVVINAGTQMAPTPTAYSYNNSDTCVDRFEYLYDITIPDGMVITPYTYFTKTWYIKNSGDCTWNSNYKLIYQSGAEVGQAKEFPILNKGYYIKPGESLAVSAQLAAPDGIGNTYTTYWAMKTDRGEVIGDGEAKNVYLSSNFRVERSFDVIQNFGSLSCYDDHGFFQCGLRNQTAEHGIVYYEPVPNFENRRNQGKPAIVVAPPLGENTVVRFEFGPLRFPRGSWFYTNFSCFPATPHCDVQIRLYVRKPGYDEVLVSEIREWNDGFMGEWKFRLDDVEVFDQDFVYAIEVQSNGGSDKEDMITFANTRIY